MKKSEFRALIREEVKKILSEGDENMPAIKKVMSMEAQIEKFPGFMRMSQSQRFGDVGGGLYLTINGKENAKRAAEKLSKMAPGPDYFKNIYPARDMSPYTIYVNPDPNSDYQD
jgi:hypothetical protein